MNRTKLATSSSTKISNALLQQIEGIPDLGRGYSLTTNTLQSSCLEIDGSIEAQSFDYDCKSEQLESMKSFIALSSSFLGSNELNEFSLFSSQKDYFTDLSTANEKESMTGWKIWQSFSQGRLREIHKETQRINKEQQTLEEEYLRTIESLTPTVSSSGSDATYLYRQRNLRLKYNVAITMRVNRLYSTIAEQETRLSDSAIRMLHTEEYINFFNTCGPNYVQSLHRAQELTAVFSFESDDEYNAKEFIKALRLYLHGNRGYNINERLGNGEISNRQETEAFFDSWDFDFDDSDIKSTLSIELLAYGLGLNKIGSDTLVSTSLDEVKNVMNFAFDSMTKSNDYDSQTGMIFEVEVFPWTKNTQFVRITNVEQERVYVPVPEGLIPTPKQILGSTGDLETVCMSPSHILDDFGKCCDKYDIINIAASDNDSGSIRKLCEPTYELSSVTMKDNLQINAEFISWMSSIARERLKNLAKLGQCVNALRSYPRRYDYNFMLANNNGQYNEYIDMKFTLKEVRAALDPSANLSILSLIGSENDEYFDMFYRPCLSSLYGRYNERFEDSPKYLMIEPWYNHDKCAMTSCLGPKKAWDRGDGNGCVDGVLARTDQQTPITNVEDDTKFCATTIDKDRGYESCKYEMKLQSVDQIDKCRNHLPQTIDSKGQPKGLSMAEMIDYFCMPILSSEKADEEKMNEADYTWDQCVS